MKPWSPETRIPRSSRAGRKLEGNQSHHLGVQASHRPSLFMREQFAPRPFGEVADSLRHGRRFFFQCAEKGTLSALTIGVMPRRGQSAFDCADKVARVRPNSRRRRDLMSASRVFRFTVRPSTRSHKSESDVNFPLSFRAFKIVSTATSPTPLMAARPKRMPLWRDSASPYFSDGEAGLPSTQPRNEPGFHSHPAAKPRCRTRALR